MNVTLSEIQHSSSYSQTAAQCLLAELLDINTELTGSEEAVPNMVLKNHIDMTLPPTYAVMIKILQSRWKVTVKEVIDTLNECERNRSMTTRPDAVSAGLDIQ